MRCVNQGIPWNSLVYIYVQRKTHQRPLYLKEDQLQLHKRRQTTTTITKSIVHLRPLVRLSKVHNYSQKPTFMCLVCFIFQGLERELELKIENFIFQGLSFRFF